MILEKVFLRDFRTYPRLVLEPSPGLNVFAGANASGKTNLLEAIHVLSTGRSPRTLFDQEMARFETDGFYLKGLVKTSTGQVALEVAYRADKGKAARINGSPAPALSALGARCPVVYFAPDEIAVVSGPPARRRAFLDQLLPVADPLYAHHLDRYRAALLQYNAALREVRTGRSSDALMPVWEEQLSLHGGEVVARRAAALAALDPFFREVFHQLFGSDGVRLVYHPAGEGALPPAGDAGAAVAWLAAALAAGRRAALERGHTLAGPHRDEVAIEIEGLDARSYASQGERRALALALKLAAAGWIESAVGERPALLLDDVLSELDGERRERLLALVAGRYQVFLTHAGPGSLQEMCSLQGSYFSVRKGEILPVQG